MKDDVLIYLNLEPYLAQWFVNEMGGEPVRLPKRSAEADILEFFLKPTPQGMKPAIKADFPDAISIVLPTFKHKDPTYFNYLPPHAMTALARCIYTRFRVKLWEDLHSLHNADCCITDLIYAWMEHNGIECSEKNWETIRQLYFRKRKIYLRKKNAEKDSEITDNN